MTVTAIRLGEKEKNKKGNAVGQLHPVVLISH
jgi:hypothetical protein